MSDAGPPFDCPCCGFPSLPCWGTAVCDICWWEVDCEEGVPDDRVSGGPNRGYSLRMARRNFEDHGHMYDLGKEIRHLKETSESRARLMAYVDGVRRGEVELEQATLDRLIRDEQDSWRQVEAAYDPEAAAAEEALLRALMGLPTPRE